MAVYDLVVRTIGVLCRSMIKILNVCVELEHRVSRALHLSMVTCSVVVTNIIST